MPIVLGIIAIMALIGGGVFFFSENPAPVITTQREEEVARIEDEPQKNQEIQQEIQIEETPVVQTPAETEPEAAEPEPVVVESEVVVQRPVVASPVSYSAEVSYLTPTRTELEMTVNLTVNAVGVVTAADIIYDGGAGFSNGFQERFDGTYSSQVVGKSLTNINLSRVGGASLTSEAFNEAVVKIESQQT